MPSLISLLPPRLRPRPSAIIGVLVPVILFGGIYAWHAARQADGPHNMPPVGVMAFTVKTEDVPQTIEAIGTLQAVNEVNLAPEVEGRVVAIHFEAGSQVNAGTPLVQLFDEPDRADRAAMAARAAFAELQLRRAQELVTTGAASRQLLQQREAELTQAQAETHRAEVHITQRTIRAPFTGQIGIRRVQLGQYVNAGTPVATLADLTKLYVNFTVPQQDLGKIRVDGAVDIQADAFPDRTFTAVINAVDPVVSTDTRNVAVQATLSNPDKVLRPGMYVTASVHLPPRAEAITVPTTAIQTTASGDSVYLIQDGKAVPAAVITSYHVGERVVVEQGLKAGDVVIAAGQLRVQPGAAVQVTATYGQPGH